MLFDQMNRAKVDELMGQDGELSERLDHVLNLAKIPLFAANLVGSKITISCFDRKDSLSSTTYTTIKGYDFEANNSAIRFFINCPVDGLSAYVLKNSGDTRGWWALNGKDGVKLPQRSVRFNGKIRDEHKQLLEQIGLTDKEKFLLDRQFSFAMPLKNREAVATIESLTITKKRDESMTVRIIPSFMCLDSQIIKSVEIGADDFNWRTNPGLFVGKVILL